MNQLTLDYAKLARRNDPVSSTLAAEKMVKSGKVSGHEKTILYILESRNRGCFTTHEIAAYSHNLPFQYLPLSNEQVHKRMKGLEEKSLIKRGIIRKCSISGEQMTEWSVK